MNKTESVKCLETSKRNSIANIEKLLVQQAAIINEIKEQLKIIDMAQILIDSYKEKSSDHKIHTPEMDGWRDVSKPMKSSTPVLGPLTPSRTLPKCGLCGGIIYSGYCSKLGCQPFYIDPVIVT